MATPTQSSPPFMSSGSNDDKKISELPRESNWIADENLLLSNGFWYPTWIFPGIQALQQNFKSHPNDVLLASVPKAGTPWVKALLFTILNRATYNVNYHGANMHPLFTSNPHQLVPWLEGYAASNPTNPRPESSLFQTHLAYPSLPEQIRNSSCRIVYVFRDSKDVFVSLSLYLSKVYSKDLSPISLQDAFQQFSRGVSHFGPYWDHVTGYYKSSIQSPDKIFLVRYKDLKKENVVHVKKLAEFLGQPFSAEEENEGVVHKIIDLCSFDKLSNLDINKNGSLPKNFTTKAITIRNNTFFRKGEIGDSKNHLTEEMIEILDQITEQKFKEFGLTTFVSPVKTA